MPFDAKCTPRLGRFLWEIYNNNKTKSENTMLLRMRQIAHVILLACVPLPLHVSQGTVWGKRLSKANIQDSILILLAQILSLS